MSLTNRILLAMVAGILTGSLFNLILHSGGVPGMAQTLIGEYLVGGLFDVVGRIFVASLKLLVVPLVMVSLICGASSLGDSARMGPIAMKTLGFYLLTTAIAVSLALLFATFIAPGSNVNLSTDLNYQPSVAPPLTDVLVDIFPSNPIRAMADGKMLQIIVFALLLGYAISHAGEQGRRLASFFRDMEAVVMKMVEILMALAPYGVFALLARLFSDMGIGAIMDLAAYFFTVLAVLLLHALGIYSLLLKSFSGLSPRILLTKMRPVWAFAFSTASSGLGGGLHYPPGGYHQHGRHRHHAGGGDGLHRPGLRYRPVYGRIYYGDTHRHPGFRRYRRGPGGRPDHPGPGAGAGRPARRGYRPDYRRRPLAGYGAYGGQRHRRRHRIGNRRPQ
jgi:Na+/H+-dicarboxylate symporter